MGSNLATYLNTFPNYVSKFLAVKKRKIFLNRGQVTRNNRIRSYRIQRQFFVRNVRRQKKKKREWMEERNPKCRGILLVDYLPKKIKINVS